MSSIIRLGIHPVVLLEISDHHTRSKQRHGFGILIGDDNDEAGVLVSYTSFELLLSDDLSIHEEYFVKRYNQVRTVQPNARFLGLYHVGSQTTMPNSVSTLLEQLRVLAGLENSSQDFLYTMISGNPDDHSAPFVTYTHGTGVSIPTVLLSSDSEFIAANTALAHSNYSSHEHDESRASIASAAQHTEAVRKSSSILREKVAQVVSYIDGDQVLMNPENQHKINLLICHLAQKLDQLGEVEKSASAKAGPINHQSDAMILGLLTEQVIATESLMLRMSQVILLRGSGAGLR